MTYEQAERWLLDLELFGMRFGLDRMHRLTTALGMPQRRFASVHVVGSNGKSSTARMLAAILERHGVRTGCYTSPHLRSFTERIEIGELPLPEGEFAAAASRVARAAELVDRTLEEDDRVTQFEALTAVAYHALARRRVEVAVVEAGLGGRRDATNVIPSRVQMLTGVALEHTRWLGPTLTDVAAEKLAVVPDHGCLVVGDLPREAEAVAERVARERHARLVRVPGDAPVPPLRARGAFQRRNFALARAAAEAFLGHVDEAALHRAAAELEVPGRLEVVGERPLTLHDAAHNQAGAAALAAALPEVLDGRPLVAVLSVLDDKDAAGILRALLPACRGAVFTRCASPRSLGPATLASMAAKVHPGLAAETVADPRVALPRARERAGPDGALLAAGSTYLIADLVREREAARASSL